VKETVRDVKFLHSEDLFAVAQKKYVYIYDSSGMEVHCLRNHVEATALEFLPYHYLLASVGKTGYLKYQDTSTGEVVAEHRTKLGECHVLKQNPNNAVLCCGHANGQISMWSPNMSTPLVKINAHKASVLALAIDIEGKYMASSGIDGQVRIWDVRTYKELHSYFTVKPTSTMDISHNGHLSLGFGSHLHVWKDALFSKQQSPYIVQEFPSYAIQNTKFCPFEDILGVSHSGGYSSLVIPGSGEANFDTFEANPFQTTKQKRENIVHSLLEKLQPDMISLNPNAFGLMDGKSIKLYDGERKVARQLRDVVKVDVERSRARGKDKSSKKARRRRKNIVDLQIMQNKEIREKQAAESAKRSEMDKNGGMVPALSRFQ
jgi:U3 small nucleolar RNA-associated protein 7